MSITWEEETGVNEHDYYSLLQQVTDGGPFTEQATTMAINSFVEKRNKVLFCHDKCEISFRDIMWRYKHTVGYLTLIIGRFPQKSPASQIATFNTRVTSRRCIHNAHY